MHTSVSVYFTNELTNLQCDDLTRAYIVSIFTKFKATSDDYSKDSLTLKYAEAKYRYDFVSFQKVADYIFFCNSLFPEHLNNASIDYYYSIGQLSYYSCYKLINKQMKIYEDLADNFVYLSQSSGEIIRKS